MSVYLQIYEKLNLGLAFVPLEDAEENSTFWEEYASEPMTTQTEANVCILTTTTTQQ